MKWQRLGKHKGALLVLLAITSSWAFLMFQLVRREYFPNLANTVKGNYKQTLVTIKEEQSITMGVFYGTFSKAKIGYLKNTISPREDGTFDIDTYCHFSFNIPTLFFWNQLKSLFGVEKEMLRKIEVALQSNIYVGPDYQIKEILADLKSSFMNLSCTGKPEGSKLILKITKEGQPLETFSIPMGILIGNPIGFNGKFPKLEIGKKMETRFFDPITQTWKTSHSVVQGKVDLRWHGKKIPTYIIQTTTSKMKSTAWVDENGDPYQYQISIFTFIKEPPDKKIK